MSEMLLQQHVFLPDSMMNNDLLVLAGNCVSRDNQVGEHCTYPDRVIANSFVINSDGSATCEESIDG